MAQRVKHLPVMWETWVPSLGREDPLERKRHVLLRLYMGTHARSLQLCLTLQPYGLPPARPLCPWVSPGKNTLVGCHFLLQGFFHTQGLNSGLLHLPALAGGFFFFFFSRWVLYH